MSKAIVDVHTRLLMADSITLSPAGRIITVTDGEAKTLDSPRDNLSLYMELTEPGSLSEGVPFDWDFLPEEIKDKITDMSLLASLIGAAASKTNPIILDTVEYLNLIRDIDGDARLFDKAGDEPLVDKFDKTYFNYTTFSYNRAERFWQDVWVGNLDPCDDTHVIYVHSTLEEAVFGKSDPNTVYNARAFTRAADDTRAVIELMHEALVVRWDPPNSDPYITEIIIEGPTLVGDNIAEIAYKAKAIWSEGDPTYITPVWSENSPATSITQEGMLTTLDVSTETIVEINALADTDGCLSTGSLTVTVVDGDPVIVPPAVRVIVDNNDSSSDAYTDQTGTWEVSSGTEPWPILDGDSVYNLTAGDEFNFNANLIEAKYAVYMRWTGYASRQTAVPVEIFTMGGGAAVGSVVVNQQTNPSRWNILGVFDLGSATKVTITSTGRSTNADAVMFMPVSLIGSEGIVMDNSDPVASTTGTWDISGGANPEGNNSQWSRTVGSTYTYELKNLSGTFDIQAKWTNWPTRCAGVIYEIYDGNASVPIRIAPADQTANGGVFNDLASAVTFNDWVRIVIPVPDGIGAECINADAIKLVPVK
jgi:hypothetical protein